MRACLLVLLAVSLLAVPPTASAETITTEEPIVLETGETVLQAAEFTDGAVEAVAGAAIRCRKVHGWHGLKHPLFGYFYWKYRVRVPMRGCGPF